MVRESPSANPLTQAGVWRATALSSGARTTRMGEVNPMSPVMSRAPEKSPPPMTRTSSATAARAGGASTRRSGEGRAMTPDAGRPVRHSPTASARAKRVIRSDSAASGRAEPMISLTRSLSVGRSAAARSSIAIGSWITNRARPGLRSNRRAGRTSQAPSTVTGRIGQDRCRWQNERRPF